MSNPSDSATQDGDQLGRYKLVATLGQGGMGRIHLAVTSGLGEFRKLLVVKELQQELASNDKFIEMFLAEAKLAARLNHPNIVQTIEAGEENGRYFLSMEFLDGQPLTELLKRASVEPAVTLGTRLQVLCEVLSGLQYAHELCDFDGMPFEIVHRDITPHNVFVTYHGQVKLVDFGIAKAVDVESLTNAGVFKGKFAYAAPEQVRGEIVDQRSDLFAVGVMLWEAIAMRRFAPGPPTRLSVDKRLRGIEPRIAEAVPTVEPALAEICDRALHIDPDQRYANAVEFRTALERYMLISGEDPQPLAALMCAKFAAERVAMHRMIDAQAKRGDHNQSVVRTLSAMTDRVLQPTASHDDSGPTRVGNLTKLIESSRIDNPIGVESPAPEWASSLRGRTNPYYWVAAGIAVVGALFFLMRSGGEAPPKPPHLTMPAPPTAQQAPPAPVAAAPATPNTSNPFASEPPSQPTAAEVAAREVGEKPARVWRSRSALKSSDHTQEPVLEAGSAADQGSTTTTNTSTTAVSRNPYRSQGPAPVQPPAAVPADRSGSQLSDAGPTMGQDLRNLRRRPQRPIDLEDPFH
ncbi:MAG TPA: serine/threonine-protein kinase [Polyangiales bacterium]|nr:serine/threonine-protein kinase [Polyangiales bacterium]